ncbi:hypothetical protein Barb4_01789 [Bacteroidales bacterium Barb4]|nr:hypothetical protein Barb4_01789 [Bacteroidales bacterium Barb4]
MFYAATGEVEESLPDNGIDTVDDLREGSTQVGIFRRQLVVEINDSQGFDKGAEGIVGQLAGVLHGAFLTLKFLFVRPCEVQLRESGVLSGKIGNVRREGERLEGGNGIRSGKVLQEVDDTPGLIGVGGTRRPLVVVEDVLQTGSGFPYFGIDTEDSRRHRQRDAHQRGIPRIVSLFDAPRLLRLLVAFIDLVFFGKGGIVLGKRLSESRHSADERLHLCTYFRVEIVMLPVGQARQVNSVNFLLFHNDYF